MNKEHSRIIQISDHLHAAAQKVNVLRGIAWSNDIRQEFFKHKAQKLPVVEYPEFDPEPILEQVYRCRKLIQKDGGIIDAWAARIADRLELSAMLLQSRGTVDFFKYSEALFGKPKDPLQNGMKSTLDLAIHFDEIFKSIAEFDFGAPPEACVLATTLADQMEKAVTEMFGELAPEIVLDPNLASNALAGRQKISIRPTACFTDKDIDQLIHHEAYVHVGTSLNGYLQPHIHILGDGHAGTTKTQEGLAIFAEFITGTTDLDRLRRLSDRVFAIQKAIDGADFIDIYRFYLERTENEEQSFQNAKRVFRGGMVTGKVPFTKDMVYLEGLINVNNFLRIAVTKGKVHHLNLLFCGKLDLSDLPALREMEKMGLIKPPRFVPPWMQDKRFLISHLSYSAFLNQLDSEHSERYFESFFL